MKRVWTVLSILSLVLCAGAVVDRVAQGRGTHWVGWLPTWTSGGVRRTFAVCARSGNGAVMFWCDRRVEDARQPGRDGQFDWGYQPSHVAWFIEDGPLARAGFGTYRWSLRSSVTIYSYGVQAPNWFLAMGFGVWPAVRWWRARDLGERCARCGYDLRATPERCPECGTAAAAGVA